MGCLLVCQTRSLALHTAMTPKRTAARSFARPNPVPHASHAALFAAGRQPNGDSPRPTPAHARTQQPHPPAHTQRRCAQARPVHRLRCVSSTGRHRRKTRRQHVNDARFANDISRGSFARVAIPVRLGPEKGTHTNRIVQRGIILGGICILLIAARRLYLQSIMPGQQPRLARRERSSQANAYIPAMHVSS